MNMNLRGPARRPPQASASSWELAVRYCRKHPTAMPGPQTNVPKEKHVAQHSVQQSVDA